MARINIEDSIFKDARFYRLVAKLGSIDAALGSMVRAWMLAQKWYTSPSKKIPKPEWDKQDLPLALLDVCLAKLEDGMIYVCGSDEQFKWIEKRAAAGKKGGEAKARNHSEKPLAKPRKAKQTLASYSSSSSFSFSNSIKHSEAKASVETTPENEIGNEHSRSIAAFVSTWKNRYDSKYPLTGKDIGIIKSLVKSLGEKRLGEIIAAYFKMPDAWITSKRHDLATLNANLSKIAAFADTGEFITQRQVRQADLTATNANLIDRIKRGEI